MKNLIKSIFSGVSLGVLITTGDSENPLVVYQNKQFTKSSGYEPNEILGKNPKIMQGPLTDRIVMALLKNSLRRKKQFIGSTYNYRKSGESYLVCWTVFPIRLMEEDFFIALIEDLADFKGDEMKKILTMQKNARLLAVEMLNRIQMASGLMEFSSKKESGELALMIQAAVQIIKELEKIVEYSISLIIAENEAIESSAQVAPPISLEQTILWQLNPDLALETLKMGRGSEKARETRSSTPMESEIILARRAAGEQPMSSNEHRSLASEPRSSLLII